MDYGALQRYSVTVEKGVIPKVKTELLYLYIYILYRYIDIRLYFRRVEYHKMNCNAVTL